jgi:integrase
VRRWQALGLILTGDKKTDAESMRLAEIAKAKMLQRIFAGEYNLTDKIAGAQTLVSYIEQIAAPMNPKTHLPRVLGYVRLFAGDLRLEAVNEHWLNAFREYLLQQKLSRTTASYYFAAVIRAIKQAYRNRLIAHDPTISAKHIAVPEPMKVHLTAAEIERLAAAPLGGELGAEIKRGFLFACMVGLRVSDIQSLKWGDIQRTPNPTILKRQKKTQSVVGVPINASAWAIIDDGRLHRADELIFPRLSQSKANPTRYFRAWARAAGIDKKIGWHTARHTFAVLSLESGTDLYTVSKLLGHTNIATTQVYAKATDSMKREAVDRLPAIKLGKVDNVIRLRKAN